jgi:3-deoxy-manno-octulosonate cytidylyltransferase (CMP-KDO synthetase)
MTFSDIAIIIPARIGSTRLPQKLIEKIGAMTVIEHVVTKIKPIIQGNLFVATDSQEIASYVTQHGAKAISTDKNCPTGSDRVLEAFTKIDNNDKIKFVINIQGDMPFIDPVVVKAMIDRYYSKSDFDIITPVVKVGKDIAINPSNVKVVRDNVGKALYFSRSLIPFGGEEFLYHVGIYGFKTEALKKFVALPKGNYEATESLEQLIARENGMTIATFDCQQIPISIDTMEDLEKAREFYSGFKRT